LDELLASLNSLKGSYDAQTSYEIAKLKKKIEALLAPYLQVKTDIRTKYNIIKNGTLNRDMTQEDIQKADVELKPLALEELELDVDTFTLSIPGTEQIKVDVINKFMDIFGDGFIFTISK
jgi:hypothetical protein